jgi:hypothetical protein
MKLKAELLQKQEEEGGDRRHQPTYSVRVDENELPRGKVAEGDFAGPNLPSVLRRGPSQKAAHQVQLGLTAPIGLGGPGPLSPGKRSGAATCRLRGGSGAGLPRARG